METEKAEQRKEEEEEVVEVAAEVCEKREANDGCQTEMRDQRTWGL